MIKYDPIYGRGASGKVGGTLSRAEVEKNRKAFQWMDSDQALLARSRGADWSQSATHRGIFAPGITDSDMDRLRQISNFGWSSGKRPPWQQGAGPTTGPDLGKNPPAANRWGDTPREQLMPSRVGGTPAVAAAQLAQQGIMPQIAQPYGVSSIGRADGVRGPSAQPSYPNAPGLLPSLRQPSQIQWAGQRWMNQYGKG